MSRPRVSAEDHVDSELVERSHDALDRQSGFPGPRGDRSALAHVCAASKSYIDHLRRNSLDTSVYEIGYWSRIARMFAVIIVTLLALPFVFGPLRTTGAGTRTVIGVHARRGVLPDHPHRRERRAALRIESGPGRAGCRPP